MVDQFLNLCPYAIRLSTYTNKTLTIVTFPACVTEDAVCPYYVGAVPYEQADVTVPCSAVIQVDNDTLALPEALPEGYEGIIIPLEAAMMDPFRVRAWTSYKILTPKIVKETIYRGAEDTSVLVNDFHLWNPSPSCLELKSFY